tara:strand:+ start:276 stop:509 length:234 start_codon:yes stop_codon:yes gene_type:complete
MVEEAVNRGEPIFRRIVISLDGVYAAEESSILANVLRSQNDEVAITKVKERWMRIVYGGQSLLSHRCRQYLTGQGAE